MTNATKTLFLILISIIVLLLLQIFFVNAGESEIFRGNLVDTDPSQVNRILIEQPSDTSLVELSKSNGHWQIKVNNEIFTADSQKIKTALTELQNMKVEALVTRDPKKHARYRVDSSGTSFTFYNDEKILDHLIVNSSQQHSTSGDIYIRLANDNNVFSVSGLRRSSIQSNFNYWRDLTVWSVPKESISEIRFTYHADSSFTIQKENEIWMAGADTLNQQKTSTLSTMLARLEAAGYPPDELDDSVSDPLYSVEFLLNDGESKILNFYRFIDAEPAPFYLATASGYPYTFTLAKRTWDQAVLLSREDYNQE